MNKQTLGEEITKLRKQHFLSQRQLAEGICTQSAVSQIERGQIAPGVDTLYHLATRLHVPMDYFIQVMLEEDMEEHEALITTIEHLSSEQKFEALYHLLCEKMTEERMACFWMSSYLKWHYHLAAYQTKRVTIEETIRLLKTLHDENKTTVQSKGNLYDRILNSIAYLLATNQQYKESLYYYDKILKNDQRSSSVTSVAPDIFTIRVMYNKSKTLYDMGRVEDSLATIETGIEKSLEKENMSLLGQFYYYKGQCFETLDAGEEDIRECYQKALFFFELLNKKLYSQLIWKHKGDYLR
ncbi:helix-turn-helix domain-containing protein [Alteribacter aurantiacus]|uniref:helix-turn-helix domain-containing protein n=1 Tax=Alteribacter aurantiacus TaxID=254410 RepID=UPI0004006E2B|nr:helix-turn-helix domain-containing protein [Alteribacter aurantiacus]